MEIPAKEMGTVCNTPLPTEGPRVLPVYDMNRRVGPFVVVRPLIGEKRKGCAVRVVNPRSNYSLVTDVMQVPGDVPVYMHTTAATVRSNFLNGIFVY